MLGAATQANLAADAAFSQALTAADKYQSDAVIVWNKAVAQSEKAKVDAYHAFT